MMTDVGLYVHVPFCVRKCNYCDFASFPPCGIDRARYIKRLTDEIRSYRDRGLGVDTVFFGGGTPSLLKAEELSHIMRAIRESFDLSHLSEFTVEVNPATLSEEGLLAFLRAGVTRFSIGLQSIHENELKILGRIHTYEDFLKTYRMIRESGVKDVSVDLMHGLPGQTEESLTESLLRVAELSPEHVSAYGLIIEEGTPFYDMQSELKLPDEESLRRMYFLTSELLSDSGYCHYEISNYAKPTHECKHNLKYWGCEEYVGVGLAAHSYLDGVRYGNSRVPEEYFVGAYGEQTVLDTEDLRTEYMMLALRLSEGLSFGEYKDRFGEDIRSTRARELEMLKKYGYIKLTDKGFALTESGFFVSNSVITELL